MSTFIIADAGSTKIEWALIRDGRCAATALTVGVSALITDSDTARANFSEADTLLGSPRTDAVYYYGTGCSTPEVRARIAGVLGDVWPEAQVEVAGDMLLAARALLGRRRGVACILGTGSNAVVCEGGEIIRSGAGLGFILGDPGSGCEIGKQLLSDYFKGFVPEDLAKTLREETGITIDSMLNRVYASPAPNRFLASFAKFIGDHRDHPYAAALIASQLSTFLLRDVIPLLPSLDSEICMTGSVAKAFESELRTVAEDMGLHIGVVTASPMEGIIEYHTAK